MIPATQAATARMAKKIVRLDRIRHRDRTGASVEGWDMAAVGYYGWRARTGVQVTVTEVEWSVVTPLEVSVTGVVMVSVPGEDGEV